jgi:hypothetical protein
MMMLNYAYQSNLRVRLVSEKPSLIKHIVFWLISAIKRQSNT